MPTIHLKPNSPEYADASKEPDVTHCEMPGCTDHANYRAPKHRGLNEYYMFCEAHIREYNKAWNFFEGMSAGEVEDYMTDSLYGNRPTWKYGVNGDSPEEELFDKAQHFRGGENESRSQNERSAHSPFAQNSPEFEAMAIMGLAPPLSLDTLRTRYRELAKKHHPDLNKGCKKSEDLLKTINMAYTLLKVSYEQFETLPERS